jgi:hypothetical protein
MMIIAPDAMSSVDPANKNRNASGRVAGKTKPSTLAMCDEFTLTEPAHIPPITNARNNRCSGSNGNSHAAPTPQAAPAASEPIAIPHQDASSRSYLRCRNASHSANRTVVSRAILASHSRSQAGSDTGNRTAAVSAAIITIVARVTGI